MPHGRPPDNKAEVNTSRAQPPDSCEKFKRPGAPVRGHTHRLGLKAGKDSKHPGGSIRYTVPGDDTPLA